MEITPFSIQHFGKEYVWQLSSENMIELAKTKINWLKIGHSVIRKKDKQNPNLIHLYASRFKTRNY